MPWLVEHIKELGEVVGLDLEVLAVGQTHVTGVWRGYVRRLWERKRLPALDDTKCRVIV